MKGASRSIQGVQASIQRRATTRQEKRFFWIGLAFASPWIVGFLAFQVIPIISAGFYSLTDFNIFRYSFVGFENYVSIFQDELMRTAMLNTLYMVAIGLPCLLCFSLIMALVMNIRLKGMPFFRTIFYLPTVMPVIACALLFLWVMNSRYGIVNQALSTIGIKGPSWLNDPKYAKISLIIMDCWRCGGMAIIFLAALKSVPQSFYEAASIDGAGTVRKFWSITLPAISPTLQFQFIIGIITMFQYFSQAFVFNMFTGNLGQVTGGGPSNSLLFYSLYLYRQAFDYLHMGYASAMAIILFVIVMIVTFIALRITNRGVNYDVE